MKCSTHFLTSELDRVGGQIHAAAALPKGQKPDIRCTGDWVDAGATLDGCAKSRPPSTGIRSPDRQTRSQSLYRLSYPGPYCYWYSMIITQVGMKHVAKCGLGLFPNKVYLWV
jgi:hypothetical protein